ncbi:bacteriophage protein; major head protein/prohead protease [Acinetobacter johnsonii]|uniref:Bacteriophage protein major head protein/prohead protease n=1 Tax=Acinetobacter johnsonii TaxID=40214 RepID=A0A380TSM3_ACIJO|nr:hypothetical protein F986_01101 [Acinetobacter johnsonii CIP 64.6]SUT91362.1 bacteriophage protein; major head protein/prohead protease [Acinetobacter johnsonii]
MNKYLKQLLDALAAKNLELQGHITKSLDGGSTPDDETEAAIQTVEAEIAAIEKNIERVKNKSKLLNMPLKRGRQLLVRVVKKLKPLPKVIQIQLKRKQWLQLNPICQRVLVLLNLFVQKCWHAMFKSKVTY